jgi:1-acyl-sn-glycerol-3-phosphate acyltransferase
MSSNEIKNFRAFCQIPFAYRIHLFIRRFAPRRLARWLATVWLLLVASGGLIASSVLSALFTLVWGVIGFFTPPDVYDYWLDYGCTALFNATIYVVILLNSVTWPVFEYCGPLPDVRSDFPSPLPVEQRPATISRTASNVSCTTTASSFLSPREAIRKKHDDYIISSDDEDTNSVDSAVTPTNNALGKTIVMSNHLSNADGLLLGGLLSPVKFVYKSGLNNVPLLGHCLRLTRNLAVHFNSERGGWGVAKADVVSLMDRAAKVLNLRIPILVFPEGARREFGRMNPFRLGFFKLAIETQASILPTVVYGTQHGWQRGLEALDFHEVYFIRGKNAIPATGHSVDSLVDAVRGSMVDLLQLCPGYNHKVERPIETIEEYEQLKTETMTTLKEAALTAQSKKHIKVQ